MSLVNALPEQDREILLLKFYADLSSTEIGGRLGLPPGTVRRRLRDTVDRLRTTLDKDHGDARRWALVTTQGLPKRLSPRLPQRRPQKPSQEAPRGGAHASQAVDSTISNGMWSRFAMLARAKFGTKTTMGVAGLGIMAVGTASLGYLDSCGAGPRPQEPPTGNTSPPVAATEDNRKENKREHRDKYRQKPNPRDKKRRQEPEHRVNWARSPLATKIQ